MRLDQTDEVQAIAVGVGDAAVEPICSRLQFGREETRGQVEAGGVHDHVDVSRDSVGEGHRPIVDRLHIGMERHEAAAGGLGQAVGDRDDVVTAAALQVSAIRAGTGARS